MYLRVEKFVKYSENSFFLSPLNFQVFERTVGRRTVRAFASELVRTFEAFLRV
jgi:hypothetical protein